MSERLVALTKPEMETLVRHINGEVMTVNDWAVLWSLRRLFEDQMRRMKAETPGDSE